MFQYIYLISVAFTYELDISSYPLLFNNTLVTSAHYFIYFKLRWNSDLDKLVIVKQTFCRTILQVCQFLNSLGYTLYNLDNPKYLIWKGLFVPLANFTFSFVILTRSPILKFHTSLRNFGPENTHSLPVCGVYFVWCRSYCIMDTIVDTVNSSSMMFN